jgi:hypothetical protein
MPRAPKKTKYQPIINAESEKELSDKMQTLEDMKESVRKIKKKVNNISTDNGPISQSL